MSLVSEIEAKPMKITWSHRLERALRWSATQHEGQYRKATGVPYIEHPMAVAMLLDRASFDEDIVIAGLLHDVVEDTSATLADVAELFGEVVATYVDGCSEVKSDASGAKRPWADRKRDHLAHVRNSPLGTRAVVLADKLHNLTCIELDLIDGLPVWSRFNASRADILAYYKASLESCLGGDDRLSILADPLDALIKKIEAL
jgi:(p)ppGpp synthase/HD superfamily hydrolase